MDIVIIVGVGAAVVSAAAAVFLRQRSHRASGGSVVAPDNKGRISTSRDTTTSGDATTVHAGGDVTGPVTTGDRRMSLGGDFGGQLVVAESGAVVNLYVAQMPESAAPDMKVAYQEARELQLAGKHEVAIKKAYSLFSSVEDDAQRAAIHDLIADSYLGLERLIEAEGQYREAIRYAEASSIAYAEATSRTNLGYLLSERGDFNSSVGETSKALRLIESLGDRRNAAGLKGNLGLAFTRLGRCEEAESNFREAAAEFADIGKPILQARQLDNLAQLIRGLDRAPEAVQLQRDALEILRLSGESDQATEASGILGNLALSLTRTDDHEEAEKCLRRAIALDIESGDDSLRAHHWSNLGVVKANLGEMDEAKKSHEEALTIYRSRKRQRGEIHELRHLATLEQSREEWKSAGDYLKVAIELSRSVGYEFDLCMDLIGLARVQFWSGELDGAEKSLAEACALAVKCGLEEQEAEAREMLEHLKTSDAVKATDD